jgi:hypothetical protein
MTDTPHKIEYDGMLFTIHHPETDDETRLEIDLVDQPVTGLHQEYVRRITLGGLTLDIDLQQLGELGSLFVALAGQGCDWDSTIPLMDGFEIADSFFKTISKIHQIGEELKSTPVPVYVAVEYDLDYFGGDYSGLGEEALLSIEGLTDENLKERFREQTGHDPAHIIHYSFDEAVDANGERLG